MTRSRRDKPTSSRRPHRDKPTEADDLEVLEELSDTEDVESLESLEELEERTGDDDPESLEELEELDEPSEDDSGVTITLTDAEGNEFDVRLTIAVGSMDRNEITASIETPLRQTICHHANDLRWKRVVVTFTGDALIPSTAKELVGDVLPDAKPLSVTVQRGYPDEIVHAGKLPVLEVGTIATENDVRVDIDSGDVDGDDLATTLRPEIDKLCADAKGKSITFCFTGGPTPPPEILRDPLSAAGAHRIVLKTNNSADVLFDRAIEELVSITRVADHTVIEVGAGQDVETTLRALNAAADARKSDIVGEDVQVNFASGSARDAATAGLIKLAARLLPATLLASGRGESRRGGGEGSDDADQLWPALLKVATKDKRTALKIVPGNRKDVARAFARELATIAIEGQDLTFDWPTGMAPDDALRDLLLAAQPARLAYSFAGENREPIWPAPMSFQPTGEVTVCALNSEAGKPVELVRAMQRHIPAQDLTGKKIDIQIQGDGMVSRTMRQTLVELLEAGGARQARLIEHGNTEYLFPKLLAFEVLGEADIRVSITPNDRSTTEIAAAAAAEFAAQEIAAGAAVRLPSTPEAATLIECAIEAGAARVILEGDDSLQVHPTLFQDVDREGDDLTITAAPDAAPAALRTQVEHELPILLEVHGSLAAATITMVWHGTEHDDDNGGGADDGGARTRALELLRAAEPAVLRLNDGGAKVKQLHPEIVRTFVDILGRREAAETPITILGIDTDDLDGATRALEKLTTDIDGRRVMVVFREDDREVTGAADNAVVQATHAFLESRAKAVLALRTATRRAPAHFEVTSSSIDGLTVGAKMRDPRAQ